MNKLELAYASHLKLLVAGEEIIDFRFEAVKLRLADSTFYTPDFLVIPANGLYELHETKGFWREDARIKYKVARELFPMFRFRAIKRLGRSFIEEVF